MRGAEVRIREHPLAALCLSVSLLVLANVARESISGLGGFVLWIALFVPAVVIGGVLLRVFWERKRDR